MVIFLASPLGVDLSALEWVLDLVGVAHFSVEVSRPPNGGSVGGWIGLDDISIVLIRHSYCSCMHIAS
jgi:hypothetical protein